MSWSMQQISRFRIQQREKNKTALFFMNISHYGINLILQLKLCQMYVYLYRLL